MARMNAWVPTAMAVLGGVALYRAHVRPWIYTWGATEPEITAELPGDELVATDAPRTTRAVTIDAPIGAVWPWLVQIGEDRAGFYSYSLLERAVGAAIHNAKCIHPEWQDLAVGDTVWLARRYGDAGRQVVAAIEPEVYLVLVSPEDYARLQRGEKAGGAWIFHLRRTGSWTRLLVREVGAQSDMPCSTSPTSSWSRRCCVVSEIGRTRRQKPTGATRRCASCPVSESQHEASGKRDRQLPPIARIVA